MSITLASFTPQPIHLLMGTLSDGEAIHTALAAVARAHHIQAATFELLGGLTEVEFSAYDFVNQVRLRPLVFSGALEIVAGHGTISLLNGAPHVHTHLTLAFRDERAPQGIAIIGGHVARAIAFAVEFTLTVYAGTAVHRALHPATGLQLWNLPAWVDTFNGQEGDK
ncbi:MAG: DNA-binding protein [Chloroflexi bacterium]|nr:DNA-binding protein [Ardenticatenaceae bacterium]MBL1127920.1 DNA-binding protein [Chloroflexota bacterium]NOG33990.1 DNA-binding protein [Chloroflexota bacterium]GIK55676.1 MAG: hypothetical protein BroJett015_13390 [Chloroflexota bacterium]